MIRQAATVTTVHLRDIRSGSPFRSRRREPGTVGTRLPSPLWDCMPITQAGDGNMVAVFHPRTHLERPSMCVQTPQHGGGGGADQHGVMWWGNIAPPKSNTSWRGRGRTQTEPGAARTPSAAPVAPANKASTLSGWCPAGGLLCHPAVACTAGRWGALHEMDKGVKELGSA